MDVPGYGSLRVGARTAGDVMSFLRARWPRCPWHGNKLLSCGPRQFHHDGIVAGDRLVLAKYSAINTEETWRRELCARCNFLGTPCDLSIKDG